MVQDEGAKAIELALIGATESGKPLQEGGFGAIAADELGARAITYGRSTNAVWDLATGQRVESAGWLRLHPDGRRGLRLEDGKVTVCDLATGERASTLEGVLPMALPALGPGEFAVGGVRAEAPADGSAAPFAAVWDLASGKRVHSLDQPNVLGAYLPGERALLVDARGVPSVWDLASGKVVGSMKGPADRPIKLRVTRDGRTAVTVSKKGTTNVWDVDARKLAVSSDAMEREYGGGARDHFELLADGRRAVLASRPGSYGEQFIGVMDLATGALDLSWTTADAEREIRHLAVFADAAQVAILIARSAASPVALELWDVSRKTLLATTPAHLAKGIVVTTNRRVAIAGNGAFSGPHYFRVYSAQPNGALALPAQPPAGAVAEVAGDAAPGAVAEASTEAAGALKKGKSKRKAGSK